jgi:NADH-quinone oxidoreductase subunit N
MSLPFFLTNLFETGTVQISKTTGIASEEKEEAQRLLTEFEREYRLSLAGVPPLSGYWAKFFVFMAGYKAGAVWLVGIGVVMTIVSLYYYLGFLKAMWMNEPNSLDPVPTPPAMNATLIVATALVLLLGLFPNAIWNILSQAALVAGR